MTPEHFPTAEAVSVIAGVVIPFFVALVTKSKAPVKLKASIAFALSVLTGVLATVIWTPGERWTDYLWAVTLAFLTNIGVHYTQAPKAVANATPNLGLDLAA